jgi:hypothetical protein
LKRKLTSDGRDLRDVANIVETGGKISEADMKKLYSAGFGSTADTAAGRTFTPTAPVRISAGNPEARRLN